VSSVSQPHSAAPDKGSGLTLVVTALVAATGGLLFGYDTGVISGALQFVSGAFHIANSDFLQETAVGMAIFGSLLGSAIAGVAADRWGRRTVLLLTGFAFGVFALMSGEAHSLNVFYVARFMVGVCIGIASMVTPLYLAEMSPARVRGALVSMNQLAITIGIFASYLIDRALTGPGNSGNWRLMFNAAVLPSLVLFIGMLFLPESPRWLARAGREADALRGFKRLGRGDEAEGELRDVQAVLKEEKGGIRMLFQQGGLRIALLVGVGLALLQQFSGINIIIYYAPTILQNAGYPDARAAILAAVEIGALNVAVTILSIFLIDRLGRRFLLLLSTFGMIFTLGGVGYAFQHGLQGKPVVYGMLAYIFFFAIGMGPVMWLLISEIYPTRIRGAAMSIATFAVWMGDWIVTNTFLSLLHKLGQANTFYLYAGINLLAFFFCLKFVPETKNKTLENIERHWLHLRGKA
jgi:MFS transporter, SP family, galactose:H+ symporter